MFNSNATVESFEFPICSRIFTDEEIKKKKDEEMKKPWRSRYAVGFRCHGKLLPVTVKGDLIWKCEECNREIRGDSK